MEIRQSGFQLTGKGQADRFADTVWSNPLLDATAPARVLGLSVVFEPGVRTAWHTHPLDQALTESLR